jgi:hypothetical protein
LWGWPAIALGALLTIGLLTPVAAILAALEAGCRHGLLDTNLSMALASVILVAVVLLGPGAFSVDARLFGRREVIIPPLSSSQK